MKGPFKLFVPLLAGATLPDRLLACAAALIGIGLTGLVCGLAVGDGPYRALLIAPMGASAVLLFAVPASPLAQPWPLVGGNTISALVGVTVAHLVPETTLAAAIAVSSAILVMSVTRSLHPPGGAVALTAVLGGPAVAAAGFGFVLVPVALNSVLLLLSGWAFHRALGRHSYPHVPVRAAANVHDTADLPPPRRVGFRPEDLDRALEDLGESFDIDRDDIDRLLRQVELRAFDRAHGNVRCEDIMSRDVIGIPETGTAEEARSLLLRHGVRTLPVLDGDGRLVGSVGLRELAGPEARLLDVLTEAHTARAESAVADIVTPLTDGQAHAVMIVDERRHLLGIVTQTDLLAALARAPLVVE